MKGFLLILCITLNLQTLAQARTGLYITTGTDLEICDNKIKLLNEDRIFCLSREPVLEADSFESISKIEYDSLYNMRHFNIRLTPLGGKHVSTIAQKLPQHKLAIVVDGILISVLNLDGIYNARVIVIWDQFDSHSIEWIHKSLSERLAKGMRKS